MKFTTSREALLKAIIIAQDVITNKSPVSILSNVLLQTAENKVIVKATNSTVNVITFFGAEIEEEGELTVFCDKFLSIVNSLPMGDVEVFSKENEIIVKPTSKKVNFKIKSLAADKFPVFNGFDKEGCFVIGVKDFKNLAKNTLFAVSTDNNRYFMTGCYLCKTDNGLTMVATDGRRMSTCHCGSVTADIKPSIIPTKILSIIEKFCGDEGEILFKTTEKTFMVKAGNLEVTTSLIDGQYPKWEKVLPTNLDHKFTVAKKDLEDALKSAAIMVSKSGRVQMNLTENNLTIISPETEYGSAKHEISAVYNGEPVEIALNAQFLSDVLKVLDSESVDIDFRIDGENNGVKTVTRALTVKESDNSNPDYTHVVMPMN